MDMNGILIELSDSDKTKFGRDNFNTQSVPQKVFSSIWAIESEVNNGGFSQYFLNSSAETAGFVVEALEMVGATNMADISRRAVAVAFPTGLPSLVEAIRSAASEFSDKTEEKLNALDLKFFHYPDNLTKFLYAYVCKHPEEFGELPEADDV